MAWLGNVSVRVLPEGGEVAELGAVVGEPLLWLLGRRHVVLLVHGFNNTLRVARKSYHEVFTDALEEVGHFFWPGDTGAWSGFSALSYPRQIDHARSSAERLADYLAGMFGPGGTPAEVSFVCHSLGCRLALETIARALEQKNQDPNRRWPGVRLLCLMAAAVPAEMVEQGARLEAAARHAGRLAVFHSYADMVLALAFPAGQSAAYARRIEDEAYRRALGRFGPPPGLTPHRIEVGYGHSGYWPSAWAARRVAELLGAAVPRELPSRGLPADPGPPPRELRPPRTTPTRSLGR